MELDEVRELVRAVDARSGPAVELLPGVLQSVSDSQGVVVLDGTTTEIGVNVIAECSAGDQVMVLFVPPRGGFVIGRYGASPIGQGWNLLDSAVDSDGDVTLTVPGFASDWTRFRLDATGRNPAGASAVIVHINGGALTMAANTTYFVNANGTTSTYTTTPTSPFNQVAEWGLAVENVAYLDMVRNGNVLSITGGGARYSDNLANNRRFFTQARATLTDPTLETVRVTDILPFFTLPPNIEFSSVTLYGLNPD